MAVHINNLKAMIPEVELSYNEKLEMAHNIIKKALPNHKGVVTCSFGKDSLIVLHLVLQHNPNIPVSFQWTRVQHKSVYHLRDKLVRDLNLNFFETRPIKDFWRCVKEYGFSFSKTENNHCCEYLKEKPFENQRKEQNWDLIFQGFRAEENEQRMFTIKRKGLFYYHKSKGYQKCQPIGYFLESDSERYIKKNSIPLPDVYLIKSRSGCLPCTSYKSWQEELAKIDLKLFRRLKKKMGKPTLHEFLTPCMVSD